MTIVTNSTRIVVWLLGILIIMAALYVLWSSTGLRDVIPEGVVFAVVLLVLGLGVLGAASQIRGSHARTEVVHGASAGYSPATERRVVDERRYDE